MNFVDFEKAFDAVHHDSLWLIMEQYGIPGKIVAIVNIFYEDFQCTVEDQGEMCEWFNINSGVKRVQHVRIFLLNDHGLVNEKNSQAGREWN